MAEFSQSARAAESITVATPAAQSAYTDRLIDGGKLAPLVTQDEAGDANASGLPLKLSVTLRAMSQRTDGARTTHSLDTLVQGQFDTAHYGAWSLALTRRTEPLALFGRIDQRGMPFDGGWQLDSAWGMVTSSEQRISTDSLARFTLPSMAIFGMSSMVSNPVRGQAISVASGERYQTGDDFGRGFERQGGHFLSASAQTTVLPTLRLSGSLFSAREPDGFSSNVTSGDSGFVSAVWRKESTTVEASAVVTRSVGQTRTGLWLDAQWIDGPLTHRASVFRFDRDLTWGTLSSVSDLEGVNYRAAYRSRTWSMDATAELFHPLSMPDKWGQYVNVNGRTQLARYWTAGGNVSLRHQDGNTAYLTRAYVDNQNAWGQTQIQLSADRSESAAQRTGISVDHTFSGLPLGRLSVSAGVDDERTSRPIDARRTYLNSGLVFGVDLSYGVSLDANVRSRNAVASTGALDGAARASLDANASANWAFSPGWNLALSYGESRGRFDLPTSLDPLQPIVNPTTRSASRYVFAALNYRYASGRPDVPLGGRLGSAAGKVSGLVFFDDNDNGRRDASETGAANLLVVLDGRFTTRTDAQGRFEFPFVASGEHSISVPTENLPLPWTLALANRKATISARDVATMSSMVRPGAGSVIKADAPPEMSTSARVCLSV